MLVGMRNRADLTRAGGEGQAPSAPDHMVTMAAVRHHPPPPTASMPGHTLEEGGIQGDRKLLVQGGVSRPTAIELSRSLFSHSI